MPLLWSCLVARAFAAVLPLSLAPPAPFPLVSASSMEREPVAPGVARATYRMFTSAGPLVISVVTVDPQEPTVRLGTVLAHDTIVSKDETTSSMARRTGAVAGINGDYFDINASGAPLGIVVRNGVLERTPSTRVALTVTRARAVRFDAYRFAGTATFGGVVVPITAVNEWPPQNGAALLTPAFGAIPVNANNVMLLDLQPFAAGAGGTARYRVAAVTSAPPWPAATAVRLAYGAAAQSIGPVPDVGDVVAVAFDTDPPLSDVVAAVGGGPQLLRNGAPVDDPASPNYAERDRRIPASAAARFADGTLALVVVDGRHPATSVGVNRAELIALLRALGATDAMLFDSGGSATLAARVLGDPDASVVNEPSDGAERPVADGLFVYSDAPLGPPARLVVRPARVVALAGARVPLRARVIDANDHGLGDARGAWRAAPSPLIASIGDDDVLHAGAQTGAANVRVARGGVATDVPVEIVDRVARLIVGPARVNPDPHATVALTVAAFDARDRPVAVDGVVRWSAKDAAVDARGRLGASDRDAVVTASAGGARATVTIPVGRHTVPLALFDDKHRAGWKLVTAPANGPGAVSIDGDRLRLDYDFTAGERAAYAVNEIPLGEPLAVACDVDGDANGEALRATFADRYGERQTVTFARAIDFSGTRRLTVKVPVSLAPPVALRNVYAVGTLANPAVTAAGTLVVHDCAATVPGAGAQLP
ncbi:MAG TPA: phosphodiester glycosidase family protein [Candidatus Elarobacter sp.]